MRTNFTNNYFTPLNKTGFKGKANELEVGAKVYNPRSGGEYIVSSINGCTENPIQRGQGFLRRIIGDTYCLTGLNNQKRLVFLAFPKDIIDFYTRRT